jgi:hypothetical protein
VFKTEAATCVNCIGLNCMVFMGKLQTILCDCFVTLKTIVHGRLEEPCHKNHHPHRIFTEKQILLRGEFSL